MDQGDGGGSGSIDCKKHPNYCNGNKPKSSEELLKLRRPKKIDLKFDPYNGPYMDELESGSITLDQLTNINEVWNSANYAYDYNNINLDEVASNGNLNPLTFNDIYDVLASPADVETLMSDRSSYRPYGYFLRLLGEELNKDLLPVGSAQGYMQFEPNYLNALMETHPLVLDEAKRTYQEDFPAEFITDYGGDLFQEFVNKLKFFKPNIP